MAQIVNYLRKAQDPMERVLLGLQIGQGIRNIQAMGARQSLAEQKQAQATALKEQYNADLEQAFADPTPLAFAKLTAKYPQQREAFKQSIGLLSDEQVKNELASTGQIYAALQAGNDKIALEVADEQIAALENTGQDSSQLKRFRDNMEQDPKNAMGYAGLMLSSIMGPKEFSKTYKALGEERRAEMALPIELDIKQQETALKKENTKLRSLEAQLRREDNELKREELELKVEEQKIKLSQTKEGVEQKKQERIAEASGVIATIDRAINTIEDIVSHPGLETATGVTSFLSNLPGTDARNVSGLIETLKAQTFLTEVKKMAGMGALSENEGKKIAAAVTNLDVGQSTKAFKRNLNTALRLFKDGKKRAKTKFKDIAHPIEAETSEVIEETPVTKSYMKYGVR